MTLIKCKNSTENPVVCKSIEEINFRIDKSLMNIWMVSTYIDFSDYEQPVKQFIDEQYYFVFKSDEKQAVEVDLHLNEVEFNDDITFGSKTLDTTFFDVSIPRILRRNLHTSDLVFSWFKFQISGNFKRYERKVYSFYELFGDVGGFLAVLFLFTSFIATIP